MDIYNGQDTSVQDTDTQATSVEDVNEDVNARAQDAAGKRGGDENS